MPKINSNTVPMTAIVGMKLLGKNELTCSVYSKKLLQPDDFLPHKLSRLAIADKKPAANANRSSKVETSVIFMP